MSKNESLETKLAELEKYLATIENDDTSIEDAMKVYEKAVKLSKECYEILNNTNGKIQELTKELDTILVDLKDFE